MKKIGKLFRIASRFKLRHLKLGPYHIIKLLIYHFKESIGFRYSPPAPPPPSVMNDWLIRKSSITILLTVFNQSESELTESLASARAQTGARIEIIIFDDGSTKLETLQFLENVKTYDNERLIRSSNIGVIAARNHLIEEVNSDFLIFLDPDDVLDPQYISKSFELLESDRSIEIVFPNVLIHDLALSSFEVWGTGPFDSEILTKVNTLPMSSIVTTRLMKQLGGYSSDFEMGPEDWDLWVRASLSGAKARHINIIGYKYTKAQHSRSSKITDHSDLISLRKIGHKANFPFSALNTIQVFLVIPWLPRIGGVEKYVKCLMEDLQEFGFKVAIVVTETDPYGYEDDVINFRNLGNLVINRNDFPSNEIFLNALKWLAEESAIGINFGSDWAFGNNIDLSLIFKKNVCFVFNTETSLERAVKFQDNFDDFWVAYENIIEHLPESMVQMSRTIYTGVVNKQSRHTGGSDGSLFTVGFLGRFSPEKNPQRYLEIAKVAENINDLRFAIAGEGPLSFKVTKQAKKLRNVDVLGFVTDNEKFFSTIDCLVISSEIEGIPLSAMEALSFGVPIISTRVGGMPELITGEEQGYLWSGAPKEAIALIQKLKDKDLTRNVSALLDEKFWRKTTSTKVINRILELQE